MVNINTLKKCQIGPVPHGIPEEFIVCTDSRQYSYPGIFVAIPGARVNPLDVIVELLEKCPLVVFQKNPENISKVEVLKKKFPKTSFLPCENSIVFLQELSREHVNAWRAKSDKRRIFAISGSNGKTTHKEMLSFILKSVLPGKVVATEKNNNNHLGVPLTLLQVSECTEIVVLELGSNHPGEIKLLCDISKPDSGITTNIGATHLEFFGTEEEVFKEEAYLYEAVMASTSNKKIFFLNVDDEYLKKIRPNINVITYGTSNEAMARISLTKDRASATMSGNEIIVENDFITGKHNQLNLITCLLIATHFYPEMKEKLVLASSHFRPTKNRSEWIEYQGRDIFLDAYNANPSSMKAALHGFKESIESRGLKLADSCIVLGDMNELGDSTPHYHKEVGFIVRDLGFPNVFFIGKYAHHYQSACPVGHIRNSCQEFRQEYKEICLKKFSIHFIKGSRSLQLESLFDIS